MDNIFFCNATVLQHNSFTLQFCGKNVELSKSAGFVQLCFGLNYFHREHLSPELKQILCYVADYFQFVWAAT